MEGTSENPREVQNPPNTQISSNEEPGEEHGTPSLEKDPELESNKEKPSTVSNKNKPGKRSNKAKNDQEVKYKIKIGSEHQAVCPDLIPIEQRNVELLPERALTMWLPNLDIPDSALQIYLSLSHEKFGYNIEQALAMLFWHKYDMDAAIQDLEHYVPFPAEWTCEDKIIFEEALLHHGKNFHRIHIVMPDKTIGELIHYYYSWKKKLARKHRMVTRLRGRPKRNLEALETQQK